MKRLNIGGSRYYQDKDGKLSLSVTEFISKIHPTSPSLISYFKNHPDPEGWAAERRAKGTAMAIILDSLSKGESVATDAIKKILLEANAEEGVRLSPATFAQYIEDLYKHGLSWVAFMKEKDGKTLMSEEFVSHPSGLLAGTVDWFGEFNFNKKRIIAILDWKIGNIYDTHALQLEIYKEAIKSLPQFKNLDIMVFNWSPKDFSLKPKKTGFTEATYTPLKNQTGSKYAGNVGSAIEWGKTLGLFDFPTESLRLDMNAPVSPEKNVITTQNIITGEYSPF